MDSINHATLLNRLQSLGTLTSALNWFQSYLTNRGKTTRIGTSTFSSLKVTQSVPQGPILGPVIFSLYTNNSQEIISNFSFESYVDGT